MQNKQGVNKAKQSLDEVAKRLGKNPFAKHLAAGTASGWVTGVVTRHVGRNVAVVVGSGIILYEIAHHNGYVKQDWQAIKQMAHKPIQNNSTLNSIKNLATKNKVFAAGFIGGFLIGIAL